MNTETLENFIQKLYKDLEQRITTFVDSPEDWNISNGHVAMCIITEDGSIYGKLFGDDKIRQRGFFKVARQWANLQGPWYRQKQFLRMHRWHDR